MSDTDKHDGGQAFPVQTGIRPSHNESTPDDVVVESEPGMSLRDYFAAKAMQGMITSPPVLRGIIDDARKEKRTANEVLADQAYMVAKAMLKERNELSGVEAGANTSKTE